MNYLIALGVITLSPYKPVIIQASDSHIIAYDTQNEVVKVLPNAPALSVETILRLQGVKWQRDVKTRQLIKFIKQDKINLPTHCEEDIAIGNIHFDLVWNMGGNRLGFLKDFRYNEDSQSKLEAVRDFVN